MCFSLIYEWKAIPESFYEVTVRVVFVLSKRTEIGSIEQINTHASDARGRQRYPCFLIG